MKLDFVRGREKMVVEQLVAREITDSRVLKAMGQVPRELFVPTEYQKHAYEDRPLPIGFGQTISQPYIVALMSQMLQVTGKEKVLDIGTGSGYQAAILSLLAKKVISVERIPELAQKAQELLKRLGYDNTEVVIGDGRWGLAAKAPFDGIICAAAAGMVPRFWKKQLKEGGRLVFPQKRLDEQVLVRLIKKGQRFFQKDFGRVIFVPLVS
jgi:protein-L-isoaspartate(D-aspartate) O-methyltransferase